ncbi:MAG TPA: SusD/RagB family nutrient-binding outer membrane lipoprotein, partial [Candidatus Avibacteroides avistercoris]|nr:SusD/RagB family nutrient-binding outer membrane lipoprotein [Candidatus Avibacteroides avistercoris]
MKINYKGISICGVLALLAASMATSCTDGFEKINDYPFSDSIPVIGGGDSNFNIDDISMPSPDSISDEERAALEANLSTIGQEFKTFTYEGLVNDYQRTTNLTHDIYAGYFANNKLDFNANSPNYVYTEKWSSMRWNHFYQDRSREYRTLANTFWYVDHEAHRNAFYMTRIWYAFLASTMADTY